MSFSTLLIGLVALAPAVQPAERRELHATRTHEAMKVDGRADESVWQQTEFSGDFVERSPNLGGKSPVQTSFAVAYDDNNLYVFVRGTLFGENAVIRTLRRDSYNIYDDDTFTLKIDPYFDRRSSFMFSANLAGAQADTLGLEDGRMFIDAWDSVWEAEATHGDGKFTLEYRIPFYALGVKGGREIKMGIEISRDDPRRGATDDWQLIVPPRSPASASAYGDLVGLRHIRSQRALEITPYLAGRTDFHRRFAIDPRSRPNLSAGFDLRIQTWKGSYAEASVLTDFSQVDLDDVQVASDRFPLYYPERRPFFINGLEVFNFGRDGEAQLFFSRRVGLNGRAEPIASGVKAYGRVGPVAYGLLDVQTLGLSAQGEEEKLGAENVAVARIRTDVGPNMNIGWLALGRHRFRTPGHDAVSGGLDAEVFNGSRSLRAYGFLAGSWYETPAEKDESGTKKGEVTQNGGSAAYVTAAYRSLYVRPEAYWLWSDKDFRAPLGFFRRPGTATNGAKLMFDPRPVMFGLRDVEFGPWGSVVTDPDYTRLLTREAGGYIGFNFRNPFRLAYEAAHSKDTVAESFELYGFEIPAQTYYKTRHTVWGSTPSNKAISVGVGYTTSDNFDGRSHEINAEFNMRLSRHFTLSGSHTQAIGRLVHAKNKFNFGYTNAQAIIAFTRNIIWDTLLRFSSEPGDERVGMLSRLRWRYLPGSDLYIVYGNRIGLGERESGVDRSSHEITFKLTFYTRALLVRS